MRAWYASVATVVVLFCAIGCTTTERPVLRDKIANVGTLSTIASRRVVVVNSKVLVRPPFLESAFCAEPSPDSSENIISSLTSKGELSGAADTTGEIAKLQAAAKLELAKNFQNVSQLLFKRTQGVQFWRDGLFSLCQSFLNGSITKEDFMEKFDALRKSAVDLIQQEIPFMYQPQSPPSPPAK
jgi:hypothetical protein